jgi:hypothetical protein
MGKAPAGYLITDRRVRSRPAWLTSSLRSIRAGAVARSQLQASPSRSGWRPAALTCCPPVAVDAGHAGQDEKRICHSAVRGLSPVCL